MREEIFKKIIEEYENVNIREALKMLSQVCYENKLITFSEYKVNKEAWESLKMSETDIHSYYKLLLCEGKKRTLQFKDPIKKYIMIRKWDKEEKNKN